MCGRRGLRVAVAAVALGVGVSGCSSSHAKPHGDRALCRAVEHLSARGARPGKKFTTKAIDRIHSVAARTDTQLGHDLHSAPVTGDQLALPAGETDYMTTTCSQLGVALAGAPATGTSTTAPAQRHRKVK